MHDETHEWIPAEQGAITLEDIKHDDVMMLGIGSEIFVCVGDDAPVGEKKHSMIKAQNFLMATECKPNYTPLHRVKSGQNPNTESWTMAFASEEGVPPGCEPQMDAGRE